MRRVRDRAHRSLQRRSPPRPASASTGTAARPRAGDGSTRRPAARSPGARPPGPGARRGRSSRTGAGCAPRSGRASPRRPRGARAAKFTRRFGVVDDARELDREVAGAVLVTRGRGSSPRTGRERRAACARARSRRAASAQRLAGLPARELLAAERLGRRSVHRRRERGSGSSRQAAERADRERRSLRPRRAQSRAPARAGRARRRP